LTLAAQRAFEDAHKKPDDKVKVFITL